MSGNRRLFEWRGGKLIAVVSDDQIIPLATSQDHKAVGDGDIGLNTGGMGAYSLLQLSQMRFTKELSMKLCFQQ